MKKWDHLPRLYFSRFAKIRRDRLLPIIDALERKGFDRDYAWVFVELCIIIHLNVEYCINRDEVPKEPLIAMVFKESFLLDEAIRCYNTHIAYYEKKLSEFQKIKKTSIMMVYECIVFGDLDTFFQKENQSKKSTLQAIDQIVQVETTLAAYLITDRPPEPIVHNYGHLISGDERPFFRSFADMDIKLRRY